MNELVPFEAAVNVAKCYLYQNTEDNSLAQAGMGVKVFGLMEHQVDVSVTDYRELYLITLTTSIILKFHFRLKVPK